MTEQKELLHQKKADVITDCGTLNVISQNNLIGNSTSRRCGFIGVDMALLEEMCHCGVGL